VHRFVNRKRRPCETCSEVYKSMPDQYRAGRADARDMHQRVKTCEHGNEPWACGNAGCIEEWDARTAGRCVAVVVVGTLILCAVALLVALLRAAR
jgi:hypothetical protein